MLLDVRTNTTLDTEKTTFYVLNKSKITSRNEKNIYTFVQPGSGTNATSLAGEMKLISVLVYLM